jgi:hypothetical protein
MALLGLVGCSNEQPIPITDVYRMNDSEFIVYTPVL